MFGGGDGKKRGEAVNSAPVGEIGKSMIIDISTKRLAVMRNDQIADAFARGASEAELIKRFGTDSQQAAAIARAELRKREELLARSGKARRAA